MLLLQLQPAVPLVERVEIARSQDLPEVCIPGVGTIALIAGHLPERSGLSHIVSLHKPFSSTSAAIKVRGAPKDWHPWVQEWGPAPWDIKGLA